MQGYRCCPPTYDDGKEMKVHSSHHVDLIGCPVIWICRTRCSCSSTISWCSTRRIWRRWHTHVDTINQFLVCGIVNTNISRSPNLWCAGECQDQVSVWIDICSRIRGKHGYS